MKNREPFHFKKILIVYNFWMIGVNAFLTYHVSQTFGVQECRGHLTGYGVINSFIHVIMYTYYGIASLGPKWQKYLWWKKYFTTMQMVQFIIGLSHCSLIFFYDCKIPKAIAWNLISRNEELLKVSPELMLTKPVLNFYKLNNLCTKLKSELFCIVLKRFRLLTMACTFLDSKAMIFRLSSTRGLKMVN
uniref:Elongation of very long chain fatty acids protein n=1 Tax=Strigamia maritima TaxID=126957 RepID=T1IKI0_STRMM